MNKKLVEVRWVDAETSPGWFQDLPEGVVELRTFGLLVRKDKNWIVLASTYDPESGYWSDKMKIPKGMVKSVREIEQIAYGKDSDL